MRGSGSAAAARWGAIVVVAAMLAGGCGTQQTPTPGPFTSPAAAATPAPTAAPEPAFADTLRVGFGPHWYDAYFGFRFATEGGCCTGIAPKQIDLGSVVYSRLYRQDAHFTAVPDLADGPCLPQTDPKIIRCRIIETTFHDGTTVTADDVAYTYRLFSPTTFTGGPQAGSWTRNLEEVRVVDPRTLDFVLSSVDPTFLTSVLPAVPILPQHAVEADYAAFVAATKDLDAGDLAKLADAIAEEIGRDPPVCSPRVEAVAALLEKIGVHFYREDFSRSGTFDTCAYLGLAGEFIRAAAQALRSTGLDAVAAAYAFLSIDRHPIGTGPYRLVSENASRIHLEAWPGYHGGLATTRYLDFVPTKADGSDLLDGSVDVFQSAYLGAAYQATAVSRGVRVATPPSTGLYALAFNVRPGRVFADVDLRKALQLCIDLPRDVDAATGGTGTPIYGPVMPGTWADDPTLPKPARDTAAARKLIEGAGWRRGTDGIYAKDGVRLAATIPVRSGFPDRLKMVDLIAFRARDCGMDFRSLPTSDTSTIFQYPHNIPGTHTPFDLFFVWWSNEADPGQLVMFDSSHVTHAKNPDDYNFTGFADPIVDRLDAAAMATYDQAERARLYRQEQQELAAQVPAIFLWADNAYDVVRAALTTVEGPLDLTAPYWAWQPERLVVLTRTP